MSGSTPQLKRRLRDSRFLAPAAAGLASALLAVTLKLFWLANQPEGAKFYGLLQGDQKFYACLARAAAASPGGFFYAYPWDLAESPSRIFFQLPITLLGWMMKAAPGAAPHNVFDLFRLAFAPLMFAALAALARSSGIGRRMSWAAFGAVAFGGGVAWAGTIGLWAERGAEGSLLAAFYDFEHKVCKYHWWFLDSFRNVLYPLEVFYHFLFYAMAAALLRRRPGWAAALYALGLASNPFVGAQMTALIFPALALDLRSRSLRGRAMASLGACGGAFLLFAFYYQVFLPSHPVAAALTVQHREAYAHSLPLSAILVGHAPLLAIFAISWMAPDFARRQLASRRARILLVWLAGTLLLTQNGRFLPRPIQPMHFTRGYLFVPLALWAFRFLQSRARGAAAGGWARRWLRLAWALPILLLPDNLLFVALRFSDPPPMGDLAFEADAVQVIEHFKGAPKGRVFCDDKALSVTLTAVMGVPTYWAQLETTPDFPARAAEAREMFKSGGAEAFCRKNRIAAFAIARKLYHPKLFPSPPFVVAIENPRYVVIERRETQKTQ